MKRSVSPSVVRCVTKSRSLSETYSVRLGAVGESGANAAACGVVLTAQRAAGEVGLGDELSGVVVLQMILFACGVSDAGQGLLV